MASHSRAVLERVSATRARLTGATSCILPSALELASLLFRRAAARPASNVRPLGHCQRLLEDSGNPCAHGHPRRCPGLVGEVSARYPVWSRWSRCIGRSSSHHPMAAASWECINRSLPVVGRQLRHTVPLCTVRTAKSLPSPVEALTCPATLLVDNLEEYQEVPGFWTARKFSVSSTNLVPDLSLQGAGCIA